MSDHTTTNPEISLLGLSRIFLTRAAELQAEAGHPAAAATLARAAQCPLDRDAVKQEPPLRGEIAVQI